MGTVDLGERQRDRDGNGGQLSRVEPFACLAAKVHNFLENGGVLLVGLDVLGGKQFGIPNNFEFLLSFRDWAVLLFLFC